MRLGSDEPGGDKALMLAVARGDRQALDTLMRRDNPTLLGYAARLASVAEAEDLVQECWLKAWHKSATFTGDKGSVIGWLHRLLHNAFVDSYRKQRREDQGIVYLRGIASSEESLDDNWSKQSEVDQWQRLFDSLPQNQRQALLLKHRQGFSTAAVGEILGITEHAAESLLARGRRRLRELRSQADTTAQHQEP